MLKQI